MTSTTPATDRTDRPLPTPQRIVVGVDGSAGSAAALDWALRQAWANGGTVQAVGSWQIPSTAGMAGYGSYIDMSGWDLEGATHKIVDTAVNTATAGLPPGVSVPVTTVVVQGYASRELLRAAGDADLLVVGSRGHGELSGMLLGSVGLHCVSHATCPVVVVHPPTTT